MQFYEPFNAPEPMSTKLSTVYRVVYLLCNDFAYQEPAYPVISGSSTSGIYVAIAAIAEHTGAIAKRINTVKTHATRI